VIREIVEPSHDVVDDDAVLMPILGTGHQLLTQCSIVVFALAASRGSRQRFGDDARSSHGSQQLG